MIGLGAETRVWLASGATDMRRGFDGLALLVQETLKPRIAGACSCSAASGAVW
jgi:transposase